MKEIENTFIPLSHSLNHKWGEKIQKIREWGFFTNGLFSKWKCQSIRPYTWHLFESWSYSWVLACLGSILVIWFIDTPLIGYSSSHHGKWFNASYIVALYSSNYCVSLPSHHCVMLYVQGNFKPDSSIYFFVDFLRWPSLSQLYFVILSLHIISWCMFRVDWWGNTSRPSFDGSLSINFETLSRSGI